MSLRVSNASLKSTDEQRKTGSRSYPSFSWWPPIDGVSGSRRALPKDFKRKVIYLDRIWSSGWNQTWEGQFVVRYWLTFQHPGRKTSSDSRFKLEIQTNVVMLWAALWLVVGRAMWLVVMLWSALWLVVGRAMWLVVRVLSGDWWINEVNSSGVLISLVLPRIFSFYWGYICNLWLSTSTE